MALYDDNTDRATLIAIIEQILARENQKDETITALNDLVSVKSSLLETKDEMISSLQATVAELKVAMANLQETLEEFQRRFFGISSEKTKNALQAEDDEDDNGKTIEVKSHTRKTRKPKRCREDIYSALPVKEIPITVPEPERNCPDCGTPMEHLGFKKVRDELRMIPAKFFIARIMQETLTCPVCREEDDTT